MRRLRSPFVLVATTVLVAGCSETDGAASGVGVACEDLDFSAPCAEEGRVCQNSCASGPYYDKVCRGRRWQSEPNGNCNPPGWPYWDSGSGEPDTRATEAAVPDATIDGSLDSSPDTPGADAGDVD